VPSMRRTRQVGGFISRYFTAQLVKKVEDPRSLQGRRWKSNVPLLLATLVGLAAGCKGLGEVEELTEDMSSSTRKMLRIGRRVPDTTLRDFLCKLMPEMLEPLLWIVSYDAWRRRAFQFISGFDFGILSLDGKYPSLTDVGDFKYLQVHHDEHGNPTHGLVRAITVTLANAVGRPIIGTTAVPGTTNEMGAFQKALGDCVQVYGRLFRLVMYDAGAASVANADAVITAGKQYFFQIADPRWVMYKAVEDLMASRIPNFSAREQVSKNAYVIRHLTILPVSRLAKNAIMWSHTRTVLRVYSETYKDGVMTGEKTRYFVTSEASDRFSPEKWLELVVLRWGVETCHQILDGAFAEDDRPWIRSNAQGALAVMMLRRVVFTLMTLYRSVTQRSEENRLVPWRRLMERVKDALKWLTAADLEGLRPRSYIEPPVFA
jgi:hypothetical protein